VPFLRCSSAAPAVARYKDSGNVYGTAWYGKAGGGVVYKIDPAGQQTVLYSFTGGSDGGSPNSSILDGAGNLYGTARTAASAPWPSASSAVIQPHLLASA